MVCFGVRHGAVLSGVLTMPVLSKSQAIVRRSPGRKVASGWTG